MPWLRTLEIGGCAANYSADSSLRFGMTESLWGEVGDCAVSSEKRKSKSEKLWNRSFDHAQDGFAMIILRIPRCASERLPSML